MGKPEGKDHLEDQGLEETVILKWLCRKLKGGGAWTGTIWLRIGTGGGHL